HVSRNGHAPADGMRPPSGAPAGDRSLGSVPSSSGFPSDAELTRFANALFSTPPGGEAPWDAAPSAPQGATAPPHFDSASSSRFGHLEEQQLNSALRPYAAGGDGRTQSMLSAPSPTSIPTAPSPGPPAPFPLGLKPSFSGAPASSVPTGGESRSPF